MNRAFLLDIVAHQPFAIYRDTSGSHVINPAGWGAPILNLPNGFPTAGTQHLNWPLPGPNDLPGVKYFLVKKGLPVGNVQLTDSFGVSLGTALPGGVLNVLLPGNGHLVVKAKDLIGRILGVANNGVVFSVKNALGQLINLPNNGLLDILDIGIDQNGTWQIGVKQGGQSDGQTIWFNVNVAANPDLDVVYPATGLLSETRELQEGGLVPIRRDAGTPITKLRLNPVNDTNGTYRLSWANSKINIWRDAARTIPVVSDQTTFPANVDTDVFLEGVTKSSAIKDVQVILKLTGPSGDMAQSSVPLTVVDAEFDIQAKFWIREQWINVPWTPVDNFFYNKIAGGDDRDNSNSPGALYRVTQLVTVIPYADLDADGIKDTFAGISYNRKLAGISTLYNKPTSVPSPSDPYSASNRLLSAASPTNSGTADLSRVYLDPLARTANNVIQTRLHGAANDPLITFSSDIDWDITIDIDGANVLVPKFNIAGGRDEYPALEIDIGDSIGRRSPQPFFWLHPLPSNVFGLMGGTLTPLPTPIQGNVR